MNGSLEAVGSRDELAAAYPLFPVDDFGAAAILPGFVNAHSHLELTGMRGYLEREESDFFAWLSKLTIARLFKMTGEDVFNSCVLGALEAARAGVTLVGDASDNADASMRAISAVGLRGIVFAECFGPDPSSAGERFAAFLEKLDGYSEFETDRVRLGISPHAPYTVSSPLFKLLASHAIEKRLSMMIHAAESKAEREFMLNGTGPFAENFAQRGIDSQPPGVSSIRHLFQMGVLDAKPLLAHCVDVTGEDIELILESGASIAHCPKSNSKFGHGRAPLAEFIRRGLKVGLGSDSVASNNTCDVMEEARFATLLARTRFDVEVDGLFSAENALRCATLGGAEALGLAELVGSLDAGKRADLAVVSLDGAHQVPVHDPVAALVFSSGASDVMMTMVEGQEVYRSGSVQTIDESRFRSVAAALKERLRREE